MTFLLLFLFAAQDPAQPQMRQGVSVQMAAAEHAVAIRAADELDATVVAITSEGRIYLGVQRVEPEALASVNAETVYVKADARVPYQRLLTVLDALRGKSVVLLATAPPPAEKPRILPPYGLRLIVAK